MIGYPDSHADFSLEELFQIIGYLTVAIEELHDVEAGVVLSATADAVRVVKEARPF